MPVRTKRWNDARAPDDGLRVLICRYRPRGLRKEDETWDAFCPALAPSKALHAAAYGKAGQEPLDLASYRARFCAEMAKSQFYIQGFARSVRAGETLTLLCSSACIDEARCHRTLVKALIEEAASKPERAGVHKR